MAEHLIGKLGYVGIALVLILGGLGLPIPEEAPIIVAAVLSRNGTLTWPLALGSCLSGVLLGDMVVYSLGYFYGEKVLSLPLTRKLLTRAREAEIKGYFRRHGFKILLSGRFVPGFRTAAYLTAGILKLPPLSLLLRIWWRRRSARSSFSGWRTPLPTRSSREFARSSNGCSWAWRSAWWYGWPFATTAAKSRSGKPVGPPVLDDDDDPLSIDAPRAEHQSHASEPESRTEPSRD